MGRVSRSQPFSPALSVSWCHLVTVAGCETTQPCGVCQLLTVRVVQGDVFLDRLSADRLSASLVEAGVSPRELRIIKELGCGLPAIIEALLDARTGRGSQKARDAATKAIDDLLAQAVAEGGWEVASYLERLLFESRGDEVDQDGAEPLTIEALRGAGLIGREEARPARLLSERLLPSLRAAVREFVDDAVEAPPAVAAALLDLAGLSGVSRDAIRRLERGGSFKPTLVVRLAGAPVGLARRSGPVDGLSPSLPRQPRGRAGRSSHTRPASPSASLLGGYDADRG